MMRRKIMPYILRVLRDDPCTRDDENQLVMAVFREMGFDLLPEQISLLHDLPQFSSIVQTRAKIQQQGLFCLRPP
jgi:hypothetical protein